MVMVIIMIATMISLERLTDMSTWFDALFAEYKDRKQAMFAFSRKQVEEVVPWEEYVRDWRPVSAGLHLRKDILTEFLKRMKDGDTAEKDSLPTLRLEWVGWRGMDHMTFRDIDTGVYYADTQYCDSVDALIAEQPNLAVVEPPHWEPSHHVPNRFEVVVRPTAEQESWGH